MAVIKIKEAYTRSADVKSCIDAFEDILKGDTDKTLTVIAEVEMKEIDMLLIGYFMLFKHQLSDLKISLVLPHNKPTNENDISWKLKLYGTYAYLMQGKGIFDLTVGNKTENFDLRNEARFPKSWYELSDKFMLLIFIERENQNVYNLFFDTPLQESAGKPLYVLDDLSMWAIQNQKLYSNVTRDIVNYANPKLLDESIVGLGKMAFYKILRNLKVLNIYMDVDYLLDKSNKKPALMAGNLESSQGSNDPYDYYEEIRYVIDEIANYPLVNQFILSTLISSPLFPSVIRKTNKNDAVQALKKLWGFTKELAYGVKELAKNVRAHASTHAGVITGRIYNEEIFTALNDFDDSANALYEGYLKYLDDVEGRKHPGFLDIHVIDNGRTGIIPRLLESTITANKQISDASHFKTLLEKDIKNLENKTITLQNLLSPQKKIRLNQQSKRSIAHLGLLIFNNLIIRNNGLLIASSYNINEERDIVIEPIQAAVVPYIPEVGTNYHIVLPVHDDADYQPQLPDKTFSPPDTSVSDIHGLEALFEFAVYDAEDLKKGTPVSPGKSLITISVPSLNIIERDDEMLLWTKIIKELETFEAYLSSNFEILNLDFEDSGLDASQIMRLLANWGIEYPKVSVVVSNITTAVFLDLINLNKDFIKQDAELHYWNEFLAIVFYHYTVVRGDRFYFADTLWGKNETDHLLLNKLVARTNFNFTTLYSAEVELPVRKNYKVRPINSAFYNDNVLLPFDILINGTPEQSLFEHNSIVLLKNEIKSKTIQQS